MRENMVNLRDALSGSSVAFTCYVTALVAALSINGAVQNFLKTHTASRWWAQWIWMLLATALAITAITLSTLYWDNNKTDSVAPRIKRKPVKVGAPPATGLAPQ